MGALAAVLGVLIMNVPIAFILISFDEVYSNRKDREHSVSVVVACIDCCRSVHGTL